MTELDVPGFLKFVRENKYALVHFWAEWNYDDRQTRDVIASLPKELLKQVAVGAMSTDKPENWAICREHRLEDMPSLAFYRDAKPAKVWLGLPVREQLIERLNEQLAKTGK